MGEDWLDRFPALAGLETAALGTLRGAARPVRLPPGTTVFAPGDTCQQYLLLLEGVVRVQQIGESGREIVLYRVTRGETCVLTTACLLSGESYAAEGITETPVEAMALAAPTFQELLATSAAFREFVFSTYGTRLVQVMRVVEDVAFRRIDARLAAALLARADPQQRVHATHQELAVELGTAREVISRQLKVFERRGWVEPARGTIRLLAAEALGRLGASC